MVARLRRILAAGDIQAVVVRTKPVHLLADTVVEVPELDNMTSAPKQDTEDLQYSVVYFPYFFMAFQLQR